MLIDKVIELMLDEDIETITNFLGYKPDDESLNNNQLLEDELESAAKQMPDDVLLKFYDKSQTKLRKNAEKNYCLQEIEKMITRMEDCKYNLKNKNKMEYIIDTIDKTITDIETLKNDIFIKEMPN